MKVKARYFATIREIIGKNEETFDVPDNATVEFLLEILFNKYGKPLRDYVFPNDARELSSNMNFLIDGKNIVMMNGLKTMLSEGCAFAIIPPVGGGSSAINLSRCC